MGQVADSHTLLSASTSDRKKSRLSSSHLKTPRSDYLWIYQQEMLFQELSQISKEWSMIGIE